MRTNSPLMATLLSSAAGGALAVKDQRFFVIYGPETTRLTVATQQAYAIVDGGASGLYINGNGQGVGYGNQGSLTSIDVPIPTAEVGETFIMHVMHRSALTTPSGWTLEGTSAATSTATQQISVLSRVCDGLEGATVTVTQASAGRLIGECVSVEGSIDSITVTTGVVNGGNTGSMTSGPVSVTSGIALLGFTWTNTTSWYNGVRGFRAPFSETMGSDFAEEKRLGVAMRPGFPGIDEASGITGRHIYLGEGTYSTGSDYAWSVTEIEAA